MTKKLFVGGLSWGTRDEQLKAAFEQFGTVASARVILDIETGRSRGFGFVEFADDAAAITAIQEMDGKDLDGRSIRVNEAQEKPRPPRDRDGGPPRGRSTSAPSSDSSRSGGRPSFRSDDRPPARGGRGRGGTRGGDDRFARKRNAQERRGRGRGESYGDSPGGGSGGGGDFEDFE